MFRITELREFCRAYLRVKKTF